MSLGAKERTETKQGGVGADHRLADPAPLEVMLRACLDA